MAYVSKQIKPFNLEGNSGCKTDIKIKIKL